jgi:hypothetical protein
MAPAHWQVRDDLGGEVRPEGGKAGVRDPLGPDPKPAGAQVSLNKLMLINCSPEAV